MNFSKLLLATVVTGLLTCCMVTAAFAAELDAGVGTVTASSLKLRAEATTNSKCLTQLPRSTVVIVENDSIDGWYKVNYNGQSGYISSQYVDFSKKAEIKLGDGRVDGNDVNVRTAPSTEAETIGTLDKGATVSILGIDNGWYKISFGKDKTGYIRSDFLIPEKQSPSSRGETAEASKSSAKGAEAVAYAKQFLGTPYVYGASSPKGFDCSGFTCYVMKHFGVSLPRTAAAQLSAGTAVAKSDLQPGDLVLFRDPSRAKGRAASHAGMYIGGNQFIHASSGSHKVVISSLSSTYYSKYYAGARRVL